MDVDVAAELVDNCREKFFTQDEGCPIYATEGSPFSGLLESFSLSLLEAEKDDRDDFETLSSPEENSDNCAFVRDSM